MPETMQVEKTLAEATTKFVDVLHHTAILIMTLAQLHKGGFRHFQTPSNFAANQ